VWLTWCATSGHGKLAQVTAENITRDDLLHDLQVGITLGRAANKLRGRVDCLDLTVQNAPPSPTLQGGPKCIWTTT